MSTCRRQAHRNGRASTARHRPLYRSPPVRRPAGATVWAVIAGILARSSSRVRQPVRREAEPQLVLSVTPAQ
ncbi:hypothetical protein WAI98_21165, partial [Acinetobacter baumannii]